MAAAGRHNQYIWRKLDWYFPFRIAYDPAPVAPTVEGGDLPKRYARAALLIIVLITSAVFITNVFLLPLQLVAYGLVISELLRSRGGVAKWPPLILFLSDCLVGGWMGLAASMLEWLGMGVTCAGDIITPEQIGEGAIIIANHPSTADWVYLWSWMMRFGDLTKLKIVLKASLHKVPIVGWALQCSRYLFLQRVWNSDREHMRVLSRHWAGDDESNPNQVQMLLFPEGTDLRPFSYDQSCAFVQKAENSGKLRQFQHVLQPRVTGFLHLLKLMRENKTATCIYDITSDTTQHRSGGRGGGKRRERGREGERRACGVQYTMQ